MDAYSKARCVRVYQPYKQGKEGPGGDPGQQLVIMIQTPFQGRMLAEFGQRVAQLDATWGTNKYGYPLTALLVSTANAGVRWAALCWPAAATKTCQPRPPAFVGPLPGCRCKTSRPVGCPWAS